MAENLSLSFALLSVSCSFTVFLQIADVIFTKYHSSQNVQFVVFLQQK